MFNDFEVVLSGFHLVKVVNFHTWFRLIGTELKSSILDHIYVKDPTILTKMKSQKPFSGDHLLIEFNVNANKSKVNTVKRRDWRSNSEEVLLLVPRYKILINILT